MPCPHFEMMIVSRGKGQSAVDESAYQAREKIYSERDHRTKNYAWKEDCIHKEVMLPANAPPEYSDRGALWNSVEAVEPNWNSQLCRRFFITLPRELPMEKNIALIREYCEKEFMEKGMVVDLCVHDPDPPNHNPHAHVLTTMRAIDEHGQWMPKCRKEYQLDDDGNRILDKNGKWKTYKVFTTDWDKRSNAEMWRDDWEKIQNLYLEQEGRTERVCLKSYERQGIDQIPTVHMGPEATAMERKGIRTDVGDLNREIIEANRQMSVLKRIISKIISWLSEVKTAIREVDLEPKEVNLVALISMKFQERSNERIWNWENGGARYNAAVKDLQRFVNIFQYMTNNKIRTVEDLEYRTAEIRAAAAPYQSETRQIEKRMKTINTIHQKYERREELEPVHEQYLKSHWKGRKEKFEKEHKDELDEWKQCDRYLRKFTSETGYDPEKLHEEYVSLQERLVHLADLVRPLKSELDMVNDIRYLVRDYLPELKPEGKNLTPERKAEKRESIKVQLAKAGKEADAHNIQRQRTRGRTITQISIGD